MKSQPDNYTNLYVNCFSSCIGTLVAEVITLPLCTIKTFTIPSKRKCIKP